MRQPGSRGELSTRALVLVVTTAALLVIRVDVGARQHVNVLVEAERQRQAVPLAVVAGAIEPTRLSCLYRGGLTLVAIAMLLLPLIYLSLIAGAAAFVWWHLTTNTWILEGGGGQWRLLAYAAPAVAGVALVFFMIKPILARPARTRDPMPVSPEQEPVLFAFIEQICGEVRAPIPRRVQVDSRRRASCPAGCAC